VLAALQADDLQAALDTARALVAASDADVASQEATLAALEHSLAYLRKEWDRATGLRESGAATDQQVDAARERFDDASGRLVAARGRLAALQQASAAAQARQRDAVLRIEQDSRLLCDAAGIVTSRQVEPGDLAVPGRTLLVVASNGLRLAFDVPQDDMATVTPGKVVSWTEPAPGGSGAVTRVHPAFAANRMRRAEVDLDAKDAAVLAIGSYVPLHLSAQRIEDATIIPAQALVTSPDAHSYVFAVEGGALHAVPVETLGRSGEDVAVRGLPPGAAVVLNSYLGWTTLGGGRAVEVIQ
jgi:multidrug efflux pump subunit AcrA (membrane-fusion protein)